MSLSTDTLLERSRLKRRLSRWRIAALIALAALAVVLIETSLELSPGSAYIARYDVEGLIQDDQKRTKALLKLGDNQRVKAVLVLINSPGGTVVGGEQLRRTLQQVAEKKPVVALLRTLATSGAYMSSLGADRIIAERGTLTGSIGVLLEFAEFTDLADKLGVTPYVIKSGPLKAVPNPMEKLSADGRQSLETIIHDYHRLFIDMVAESRELPREEVEKLADGRVYTGGQAYELKLVDELGGEAEALRWLQQTQHLDPDLKVIPVKPEKGPAALLDSIHGALRQEFQQRFGFGVDGLMAIWQPPVL